jgi:hypothetical protein
MLATVDTDELYQEIAPLLPLVTELELDIAIVTSLAFPTCNSAEGLVAVPIPTVELNTAVEPLKALLTNVTVVPSSVIALLPIVVELVNLGSVFVVPETATDVPLVPVVPDVPEVPVVPDVPDTPDEPLVPVVPEVPVVPDVPDTPDEPLVPVVPEVPVVPDVPDTPDEPLVPVVPEVPVVPLVPDVPDVPDEPLFPEEPDVPLVPEVPLVPDVPLVPEAPTKVSLVTLYVVVFVLSFITTKTPSVFPEYVGKLDINMFDIYLNIIFNVDTLFL